jgi:hypothetical protein
MAVATKGTQTLSPLQLMISRAKTIEQGKAKKKAVWSDDDLKALNSLAELIAKREISQLTVHQVVKDGLNDVFPGKSYTAVQLKLREVVRLNAKRRTTMKKSAKNQD